MDMPVVPLKEQFELIEIARGHPLHDGFIRMCFQALFLVGVQPK
jgi:hypothetical protein